MHRRVSVGRRARQVLAVAVLSLLGGVAGLAYAEAAPPSYSATTTLYFSLDRTNTVSELLQGSTYTREAMSSYERLATTSVVLDPVVERLGLDTTAPALASRVTVDFPPDTVLLNITVRDSSATRAADIANATSERLIDVARELAPTRPDGSQPVTVETVATAQPATRPTGLGPLGWAAAGAAAGCLLGVLVALLLGQRGRAVGVQGDVPQPRALPGGAPADGAPARPSATVAR